MRKLFLTSIAALFLATGAAQPSAYADDKWITNCRSITIEKRFPAEALTIEKRLPDEVPMMFITPEDLPTLEKEIKELKKGMAWWKCIDDRAAGKVKHCYENDKRWR